MKFKIVSVLLFTVTFVTLLFTLAIGQQKENKAIEVKKDQAVTECLAPGHKAASAQNFDEAIKIFSGCVEKYPNAGQAHFFLGMAYFHKKDVENATNELKKAYQLDPNNLEAAVTLGRLYSLDKEKLSLSRELLERVISVEPSRDDVHFDLARVYAMSGEEKKSLREFQIIFSGEPRYGIYHTEFARILIAAGQNKAAMGHLQRALALSPNFEPAKKLLESLEKQDKGSAPQSEAKTPR